jgi:ketosteroid isomerase-like protein
MDPKFTATFLHTVRSVSEAPAAGGNQGILLAAFDAIVRSDFDSFGEFLTDDVELRIAGSGLFDGMWSGREQVLQAVRANYSKLADQKPEIEAIVSDGDNIALRLHESGMLKADGRTYRLRGVQWFTFADGKIRFIDQIITPLDG